MSTVLGSSAPPVTVKLVRAFSSGLKDASIIASQVSHNFLFLFPVFLVDVVYPSFVCFGYPLLISWVHQWPLVVWFTVFSCVWCRNSSLTKKVDTIFWMFCQKMLMLEVTFLFLRYSSLFCFNNFAFILTSIWLLIWNELTKLFVGCSPWFWTWNNLCNWGPHASRCIRHRSCQHRQCRDCSTWKW